MIPIPKRRSGRPLKLAHEGKIRQIYDGGVNQLLAVTSDAISSFDYVLPDQIPHKGIALNLITAWFKSQEEIRQIGPNDLITINVDEMPFALDDYFRGRSALIEKTKPIPIECIVRGNHTGSGYRYWLKHGTVYGQQVPSGLEENALYPEPLFTPSTKADAGQHDENIPLEELEGKLQKLDVEYPRFVATELRRLSIAYFVAARELLKSHNLLLADCKLEFGWYPGQGITLIDECFTPDASRLWLLDDFERGRIKSGVDKDNVRDALREMGWEGQNANPPHLTPETLQRTTGVYDFNLEAITGRSFADYAANGFLLVA